MTYTTAPTNRFRMHFVDDVGKPATVEVFVDATETDPAGGGCATLASAAAACSADALIEQEVIISATNDDTTAPTDGPYARGADKAGIWMRSQTGQPIKLEIGAPQEEIFSAGNVLVNPAETHVAALIAGFISHACDASGLSITGFERGYRFRPAGRKKQ